MPSGSSAAITSTSIPTATQLARYGLMVGDVQDVIAMALGGEAVTTTVEGPRALHASTSAIRATFAAIRRRSRRDVLIPMPDGGTVPLGQVAKVEPGAGPDQHPHRERASSPSTSIVDIRDRDLGGYVADAQKAVAEQVQVSARLLRHLERPVRISASAPRRG